MQEKNQKFSGTPFYSKPARAKAMSVERITQGVEKLADNFSRT
jgi:hypothetical protein